MDHAGEPDNEPDPAFPLEVCVQTMGTGRSGDMRWNRVAPSRAVIMAVRDRLEAALRRVEAMLER